MPADGNAVPHSVYQLVKACGSDMVLESPTKRMELVESIWKQLREKGKMVELLSGLSECTCRRSWFHGPH